MNWIELNIAIEKKAVANLESHNVQVKIDTIQAATNGIYKVMMSYLTQEQIEEIIKTHKLEL
jgi:hypothetical protein